MRSHIADFGCAWAPHFVCTCAEAHVHVHVIWRRTRTLYLLRTSLLAGLFSSVPSPFHRDASVFNNKIDIL